MKQSMDKKSLGDRMKLYYEQPFKVKLPMRIPVIIRLDGKAFHTLTRNCMRPFDLSFISLMQKTAKYLCENIQGAQIAYTQSDEISILLHNYKQLNSEAWFGNEVQKIVSVSAALASSYFSSIYQVPVQFDSRVFVLPETEVCNYFIWRQQDWERNSIQMMGQSLFSHGELQNKNNKQIQEMCFIKNGTNWNNYNTFLKRGSCIYRMPSRKFETDKEIPIFTQQRNFIEKWLCVEED